MTRRMTDARRAGRSFSHIKRSTPALVLELLLETRGQCWYCGVSISVTTLAVDHILPISRGGSNQRNNLRASCRGCNQLKKDQTLEEFRVMVCPLSVEDLAYLRLCGVAVPARWHVRFWGEGGGGNATKTQKEH